MNYQRESDPRFPSGIWRGYYTQPNTGSEQHLTEAHLHFFSGQIEGWGEDKVGSFNLEGGYRLTDGSCFWTKHYHGRHSLAYRGEASGGALSGIWEASTRWWGQFQLRFVG